VHPHHAKDARSSSGRKAARDVVGIATNIDDARVALLEHLEHEADKPGVDLRPMAGATELPAVDDMSPLENELLAAHIAQENGSLRAPCIRSSKVDIGD